MNWLLLGMLIWLFLVMVIQLLGFIPLFGFFYISDATLLKSVPSSVYSEYITEKSWYYFGDGSYTLEQCRSDNQTLFLVASEYESRVIDEKSFDINGNKVCTNEYSIYACKESCPYEKCINSNFTCEVLASKYPSSKD